VLASDRGCFCAMPLPPRGAPTPTCRLDFAPSTKNRSAPATVGPSLLMPLSPLAAARLYFRFLAALSAGVSGVSSTPTPTPLRYRNAYSSLAA